MEGGWWSKRQVADYLSVSVRTVDRLTATDQGFPQPIRIGPKERPFRRWLSVEVERWAKRQRPA
jgi:predicted DNA-binding transcriptional regulator AlpA